MTFTVSANRAGEWPETGSPGEADARRETWALFKDRAGNIAQLLLLCCFRMNIRAALIVSSALCCPFAMAATATAVAPVASAPAQGYFHKSLAGKIGGKYSVTFDLKNLDSELSGTYRYGNRRASLYLRGKLDPSGSFVMEEFDGSKVTGTFKGNLVEGHMAGTWRSPDGLRTLEFVADQTSEIHIGSKREILAAAIGTYPLITISGSGGANAMWDTWKDHGRWKSSMSGISGGMREASEIELTKADRALLDGLQVVVDADLSVRLVARGKDVLKIPFQADGIGYDLARPHNEVAVGRLKPVSARTIVYDENLYLLVRDGVDYSASLSGSFEAATSDILVVSYSIVGHQFEVSFLEGQCCGATQWTFGPRKP